MKVTRENIWALVYGLAAGDAIGVPVEFVHREKLAENPVKDMRPGGTHNQLAGTWSDDTSMTICLMDSMSRTGRIDYSDIMSNFVRWYEAGEFTAHGETFDIGNTSAAAIHKFMDGVDPMECGGRGEGDNGNGSLMRIAPMALWIARHPGATMEESMDMIHKVSALTHAHPRSMMACGLYVLVLLYVLQGRDIKDAIRTGLNHGMEYYQKQPEYKKEIIKYNPMMMESFSGMPESKIKSGGYVVDTLAASMWCLLNSENYKECILKAVNLGSDTDTVGAVTGAVAGLAYGFDSIPKRWLNKSLKGRSILDKICENFAEALEAE